MLISEPSRYSDLKRNQKNGKGEAEKPTSPPPAVADDEDGGYGDYDLDEDETVVVNEVETDAKAQAKARTAEATIGRDGFSPFEITGNVIYDPPPCIAAHSRPGRGAAGLPSAVAVVGRK